MREGRHAGKNRVTDRGCGQRTGALEHLEQTIVAVGPPLGIGRLSNSIRHQKQQIARTCIHLRGWKDTRRDEANDGTSGGQQFGPTLGTIAGSQQASRDVRC